MSERASALWRLLRSRRVAVWLLILLAVWCLIGTLVPQQSASPDSVAAWSTRHPYLYSLTSALDLHSAFSSPVFLGGVALLFLSTAACAWERSIVALRRLNKTKDPSSSSLARLETSPTFTLEVGGVPPQKVLDGAEEGLKDILRVRPSKDGVVVGTTGRWRLLGSPVFHWALAALILVVGAGRLTRSEGLMGVPVGASVPDVAASYGVLDEGLLFAGHPDVLINVSDLQYGFSEGGVDRGDAPLVTLIEGSKAVASGRVYPNHPLRHGTTTIHRNGVGYAAAVYLESPSGSLLADTVLLLDPVEGADTSTVDGFDLEDEQSAPVLSAEARLLLDAPVPTLEITARRAGDGSEVARAELTEGRSLQLPSGDRIVFGGLTRYVRLSVVHDWSVIPIYALLAVAAAGVSVAVVLPFRQVLVKTGHDEQGTIVLKALIVEGSGRSVLFEDRVRQSLQRALHTPTAGRDDHDAA